MILGILNQIADTSSKNAKIDLLKEHANNSLFKQTIRLAYCPLTQFYIRQIPEVCGHDGSLSLKGALDGLSMLSDRVYTGNDARLFLKNTLTQLSEDDAKVVCRVIGKDLRAGFSDASINKAMGKGTIKETPYMGAVSYSEAKVAKLFKNHSRVYSEVKMDGRYSNIRITKDSVFLESRNGKPTYFGDTFSHLTAIRESFGFDVVLNGELIIPGMDRYASNGVIASIVSIYEKMNQGINVDKELVKFSNEHHTTLDAMAASIMAVVWDYIPLDDYHKGKWEMTRRTRMHTLGAILAIKPLVNIAFIEVKKVANAKEALLHFKELLAIGEEGTILKGSEGSWKKGKPTSQVKFKLELMADLKIVSFNYGTKGTKNEHVISSINVESSDGLLKTSPTGISEKLMKYLTDNQDAILGSIVEVKCSGLSSNSLGKYALLHPVLSELRSDKTTADSLQQVTDNEQMITQLGG